MKTTKVIGTICAVALMAGLAIGCESSESTTSTADTVKATTTTVAKASPTDAFVNAMKVKYPNSSRTQLIDLGETSCEVIDAFGSVEEAIFAIAEDPTWDREMANNAGYTFGAAIPVFCPEYLAELNAITG